MCDRVNDLYAGGTQPCLLAILQAGTGRDLFHHQVKKALEAWIGGIADVLVELGLGKSLAQQRSEDALISIQGALMVSQALDDPTIFRRTTQNLPQKLCYTA